MVGRTVLQYELGERLGTGGMGEVYRALDTRLNRPVAIKVLSSTAAADPEFRSRFIHEARAASALNHPNIITIYDVVHDGDTQYMVTEYVDGKTLLELLASGPLPVADAVRYAMQMADALAVAHAAGIVHRDLKPANVMVNSRGLVKVLDFGLAKHVPWLGGEHTGETTVGHNPLTMAGAIMGTVNYMSPEQAEGRKLDARSDIFSFGTVLYEMLTGRSAFRGNSAMSTMTALLRDEVQPIGELRSGVPASLEQLVARCLQKEPGERFQSMEEVSAALAAVRAVVESGAPDSPATMRTVLPAVRRESPAKKIAALVAVLLVLAASGYWWATRRHATTAPEPRPARQEGTLTNDSIIAMVGAKVAPSVIASQIRTSKTNFDLSASEVIRLTKAGVPADLIEVMRNPTAPPPPVTIPVTVADGLPIRLSLAADIPSDAAPGDSVRLRVASDLRVDDSVVALKGAPATGYIVDGAKRRIFGIGGKMTLRFETADAVNGRKLAIRATTEQKRDGDSKRSVNGSGRKAKDVASAAGTEYMAYVDGEQTVQVKVQPGAAQ